MLYCKVIEKRGESMSIDALQTRIRRTKNPSMIGLDPTIELLPPHLLTAAYAEQGQTLEAVAQAEVPGCNGAILPPVIFPEETESVRDMLAKAWEKGIRHLLVGNIGHLYLCDGFDFVLHGDYRLNAANTATVCALEQFGFADVIASAEMSLARLRDLGGNTAAIVYGRVPLMTLERCVNKQAVGCAACTKGKAELVDRRGVRFPVVREFGHRNLVLNSLPTGMSDKGRVLADYGITAQHFLFTTESADEVGRVISAYKQGRALPFAVRRI